MSADVTAGESDMAPGTRWIKSHFPFLLVLAVTGILYSAILLTSQSHVDGDEAVIGVMARHILANGERPIFFYGQTYGGGGAVEAYLAVIPFLLFGESSISLKLVAWAMSMAALVVVYVFTVRYFGPGISLLSVTFLAVATPLVEWHTKMRGGYAGLPLFVSLLWWVYAGIVYGGKTRWWRFFVLGLCCGLAFYYSTLVLSLLTVFLLNSILCWRTCSWKRAGAFLLGLTLGLAPLICYDLAHSWAFARFVWGLKSSGGHLGLKDVIHLLFDNLGRFFVGRNVDQYVVDVPWTAWAEYWAYVIVFMLVGYGSIRGLLTSQRTSESRQAFTTSGQNPAFWIWLSVGTHLVFCVLSKDVAQSPRYFLPLFPALSILAGVAVSGLWHSKGFVIKLGGAALGVFLLGLGVVTHTGYIRPCMVNDDVRLADGRMVNVPTACSAPDEIIAYLRQQSITYVRCAYFLQWRLLFESHGEIIASSEGMDPGLSRFPMYDQQVRQAERVATIFHQDAAQLALFAASAPPTQWVHKQIAQYVVWVPVK